MFKEMNRVTSSSNAQTKKLPQSHSHSLSQPQPPAKKEKNLKRERFPANPLRGLSTRSSGSSSGSNVSGSGSVVLLSHSFSSSSSTSSSLGVFANRPVKSMAKTPKSAPVVSKPLIRKKPRFMEKTKLTEKPNLQKPRRLNTTATSDEIAMKPNRGSVLKKQTTVSRGLKLRDRQTTIRVDDSVGKSTPVSKLGTGTDVSYRSNGEAMNGGRLSNSNSSYQDRTPPVQASVSPEIQCGSSMNISVSAQSEACYAAGHLLSGVKDKRKCKPKGILTVGENGLEFGKAKILNDFDDEGEFGNDESYNNFSIIPLPADASVHWLLSPCDEEKEQQIVECVGHETPSPRSDRSTSSDLCNISRGRSLSPMNISKEKVRRTSSSLSPNELSRFRRFMQLATPFDTTTPTCELDPSEHLKEDKPSPLSVDTLGSENVIQTPESNSSFDRYFELSSSQAEFQKKNDVASDLESLTMTLQSAGLSPRSQTLSEEPNSSSFNFDSLATSSVSIDLSHFQKTSADSHVTVDRVSQTHEIVSSHMPEMKLQGITDTENATPRGKGRELLQCSAAESISTNGGSLICSEDSNWMQCYKNNFLHE